MSVKDDLIAAKSLIDTPEKWITGTWSNGAGTCFCAVGAIRAATACPSTRSSSRIDAVRVLALAIDPEADIADSAREVTGFNDNPITTHADVMAAFDRAIEAAS